MTFATYILSTQLQSYPFVFVSKLAYIPPNLLWYGIQILVLMPYDISHLHMCLIIPMLLRVQSCSYLLQCGSVIM